MVKPTLRSRHFYKSKGEYGIKRLRDEKIAILYIPNGEFVHFSTSYAFLYAHEGYDGVINFCDPDPLRDERYSSPRRSSGAEVVSIIDSRDGSEGTTGLSINDGTFKYEVQSRVVPRLPYDSHDVECSSGIHYYISPQHIHLYLGPAITEQINLIIERDRKERANV